MIWNNRDLSTSTTFYVDIFNVQQPKSTDTSPNKITVTVDTDGDYEGGVHGSDTVTDTAPGSSSSVADIVIE